MPVLLTSISSSSTSSLPSFLPSSKPSPNMADIHSSHSPLAEIPLSSASSSSSPNRQSSIHAFSLAERSAFVRFINDTLAGADNCLGVQLPLDPCTNEIFDVVRDGVLLSHLIMVLFPGSIQDKQINRCPLGPRATFLKLENHQRCLDAARSLGCHLVNISAEDLLEGKSYLVFGLLWQIIRASMVHHVNFQEHPELLGLLQSGEDTRNMPPETILLRWLNWHLERLDCHRVVRNFGADLADCTAYLHLMHSLDPETLDKFTMDRFVALSSAKERAAETLRIAARFDPVSARFLTADDILAGREKLNLCLIAGLFNSGTGMAPLHEELEEKNQSLVLKVDDLGKRNNQLVNELDMLRNRVVQLEVENKALGTKVQEQHDELIVVLHDKRQLESDFTQAVEGWTQRQESLISEIDLLKSQVAEKSTALKQAEQELKQERMHSESFGMCADSLTEELDHFRTRQERMEYLIEHLKMERERSDINSHLLRKLFKTFSTTEQLSRAIYCTEAFADGDSKLVPRLNLRRVISKADKTGYLTKKGRDSNNWRIRFIVIRDNFLFYFKNDTDLSAEPKGVIRLDDATVQECGNPTKTDLKGMSFLCIDIPDHGHWKDLNTGKPLSFYLAGSPADLQIWKLFITKASGWWTRKSSVQSIKDEFHRRASIAVARRPSFALRR